MAVTQVESGDAMSPKSIRHVIAIIFIGALLIGASFLKGRVVYVMNDAEHSLSCCFFCIFLILGMVACIGIYIAWHNIWLLPSYWHAYRMRKQDHALEKGIMQGTLLSELGDYTEAVQLFNPLPQCDKPSSAQQIANVLRIVLAYQHHDFETVGKLIPFLQTEMEPLNGLYKVFWANHTGQKEEALLALDRMDLEHNSIHKELILRLRFLICTQLAQNGQWLQGNAPRSSEGLSAEQMAVLYCLQAHYYQQQDKGATKVTEAYRKALEYDPENVEAILFIAPSEDEHKALGMFTVGLKSFPYYPLAEALIVYSCSKNILEKFQILEKVLTKYHEGTLEALYCLGWSALKAGLTGQAAHYANTLADRFAPRVNEKVLFLQKAIKRGQGEKIVFEDLEAFLETEKGGLVCDACAHTVSQWQMYCPKCGTIRSIWWR